MTRAEYIEAVKVKLEEISPFDEPNSFIAAEGDTDYQNVKPIVSYIDESLDEATHNCLLALPLTLLHADIDCTTGTLEINEKGVGIIAPIQKSRRFIRVRQALLKRDITAFISSEDSLYLLQQNQYTRGGIAKPVAVLASDSDGTNNGQMEIYSFPESTYNTNTETYTLLSIDTTKHPDNRSTTIPSYTDTSYVKSPIEEYIVLECAAMVAEILGDTNAATICRQEQATKIQAQLQ